MFTYLIQCVSFLACKQRNGFRGGHSKQISLPLFLLTQLTDQLGRGEDVSCDPLSPTIATMGMDSMQCDSIKRSFPRVLCFPSASQMPLVVKRSGAHINNSYRNASRLWLWRECSPKWGRHSGRAYDSEIVLWAGHFWGSGGNFRLSGIFNLICLWLAD